MARGWQGCELGPGTLHALGLGAWPSARMSRAPTRMINPKHQGLSPGGFSEGKHRRRRPVQVRAGRLGAAGRHGHSTRGGLLGEPCAPLQRADSVSVPLSFLFSAPQVHGAGVGPPLGASLGPGLRVCKAKGGPGPGDGGACGGGDTQIPAWRLSAGAAGHTCTSTHAHVQTQECEPGPGCAGV